MGGWGVGLTALGYVLAIIGSSFLFFGTPRETGIGRARVGSGDEVQAFLARQAASISQRERQSRRGFGFLLAGMVLQLGGLVAAAYRG